MVGFIHIDGPIGLLVSIIQEEPPFLMAVIIVVAHTQASINISRFELLMCDRLSRNFGDSYRELCRMIWMNWFLFQRSGCVPLLCVVFFFFFFLPSFLDLSWMWRTYAFVSCVCAAVVCQLENGQLVSVPAVLIRRLKQHVVTLPDTGVDVILGTNGNVWISRECVFFSSFIRLFSFFIFFYFADIIFLCTINSEREIRFVHN